MFVFEEEYDDGKIGEITLDSSAGASVWRGRTAKGKILPKKTGMRTIAANGTEIINHGSRKVIRFRGVVADADSAGFSRRG